MQDNTTQRRHSRRAGARRNGRTVALDTAIALCAALVMVGAALMSGSHSPSQVETVVMDVSVGDSLWTLAAAHPVPGLSTAQTVDLIAELNGLSSSCLQPGDSIAVPADASNPKTALAMR